MRKAAIKKTFENRPDILENIQLTEEEKKYIEKLKKGVVDYE